MSAVSCTHTHTLLLLPPALTLLPTTTRTTRYCCCCLLLSVLFWPTSRVASNTKIRGSVVSLRSIFSDPPEDEKTKKNVQFVNKVVCVFAVCCAATKISADRRYVLTRSSTYKIVRPVRAYGWLSADRRYVLTRSSTYKIVRPVRAYSWLSAHRRYVLTRSSTYKIVRPVRAYGWLCCCDYVVAPFFSSERLERINS